MIEFYRRVLERIDPFEPQTKQETVNRLLAAFMAVWEERTHLGEKEAVKIIAREMSHDQPPVPGRREAIRQILDAVKQKP